MIYRFAECFRLYTTNHSPLLSLRPKTWNLLYKDFEPVSNDDWLEELNSLGFLVPNRIVKNLIKKV